MANLFEPTLQLLCARLPSRFVLESFLEGKISGRGRPGGLPLIIDFPKLQQFIFFSGRKDLTNCIFVRLAFYVKKGTLILVTQPF